MSSNFSGGWEALDALVTLRVMMEIGLSVAETVLLEGCSDHWTIEDALGEPDWEDWRDFLRLNSKEASR